MTRSSVQAQYPYYLKQRILSQKGHLSNEEAAVLVKHLAQTGTKKVMLGHLSEENNFPELAYTTVREALTSISAQDDVKLSVAARHGVTMVS